MSDCNPWTVHGFDGSLEFEGSLLAAASSRRQNHSSHNEEFAPPGLRCSACRWFEVRIFRTCDDEYVVEMTGQTLVPRETVRHRAEITRSPRWVVEMLTQSENNRRFIPMVSKRVLAEAATRDTSLEDAYTRFDYV
jgi:hypothetical protein